VSPLGHHDIEAIRSMTVGPRSISAMSACTARTAGGGAVDNRARPSATGATVAA
jgi:hypothetical protein